MFPEVIVIIAAAFTAGIIFKAYWAKKEEVRWEKEIRDAHDDRHHFIYRWNVATCQIGAIKHMVTQAIGNGSSPYRGDSSKLIEVLHQVRLKTEESLNEVCREIGCFHSLEEAEAWLKGWTGRGDEGEPHTYPMIIKHEEWDGTCWHVIYGSDVEKTDIDTLLEDSCKKTHWNPSLDFDPLATDEHIYPPHKPNGEQMEFDLLKEDAKINVTIVKEKPVDFITFKFDLAKKDKIIEPTEVPPSGMKRF